MVDQDEDEGGCVFPFVSLGNFFLRLCYLNDEMSFGGLPFFVA